MKQPGAIGYVVINFDGKRLHRNYLHVCRHSSEVLPRGQDPRRVVRGPCRGPSHEDKEHPEAAEPGRLRFRLPQNENEAGHRDDRDRLYSTGQWKRVYPRLHSAVQIRKRGRGCR